MASYFANVTLFDGRSMKTKAGVLVSGGDIAWVGAHARAPKIARAAHEVDGTGTTLTPGLIDAHVHLCFDGSADFAGEAAAFTDTLVALKAMKNAVKHLEAGVTSVRDLGGWKSSVIEVGAAIERGMIPGPRVVAAGQALTITGGHGHNIGVARQVDGPDALRKAVREEIRAGARVIKLIATGGVLTPGITAEFTAFTPEELEAAVDEAHSWGRGVAAHAIGAAGILQAVLAGVDSIEHGSQISAEAVRLMKGRASSTFRRSQRSAASSSTPTRCRPTRSRKRWPSPGNSAMRSGAPSEAASATRAGPTPGRRSTPTGTRRTRSSRWSSGRMTPLKAMQAATSNAAELLRLPDVGSVETGKAADLVVYAEDPIEQIATLLEPVMVMKAGEVVAGRDL